MRLFIAVNFPAPLRRSIAGIGRRLDRDGVPARWVKEPAVHLTLKFLGECPPERLAPLSEVLDEVAGESAPFTLRFEEVGAFPSPRRPRVIWIGVEAGPRLRLLHDALERRLLALGVPREDRPFRPHVTLGRTDRDVGPGQYRGLEAAIRSIRLDRELEVRRIELMESVLRPEGPEHRRLHAARLGGG
ncbi:MAG: RNA 2',3'-cyclic phosphodiesterase [Gemmatimonadota bacterium]